MQNTNENGLKQCTQCKEIKSEGHYGNRLGKKQAACKVCLNKKQKIQYANNTTYYLDRNRNRRAGNRDWYQELKNKTPCAKCGVRYPHYVMDFDHKDPSTKTMCIAKMMGYSKKAILHEINKCELLCANCHREKTYATQDRQQQHRITTSYKRPRP